MKELIALGCPVNERLGFNVVHGPKKGSTPLTLAVRRDGIDFLALGGQSFRNTLNSRIKIVKALLAAGADPNLPDARGIVPLLAVAHDEDERIPTLLIEAGADRGCVEDRAGKENSTLEKVSTQTDPMVADKNRKEFLALWNKSI